MLPPAAERVKEKRVGFPHDLVTVIRASAALAHCASHWRETSGKVAAGPGRKRTPNSFSQETCLLLVRELWLQITRNWLYQKARKVSGAFLLCVPRGRRASFFCPAGSPVPFYQTEASLNKRKRKEQTRPCVNSIGKRRWPSLRLWHSALAPWQAAAAAPAPAPPLPVRQPAAQQPAK